MIRSLISLQGTFRSACILLALSCNVAISAEPPRLVVVISVDQLCQDYLVRFADNFSDLGLFRRIQHSGAQFSDCHHRHAFTVTAPGHAVQLSGAYPSTHGIIANEWFDRALKAKRYCVDDPLTKVVGTASKKGMSPRSLLVDTTGDQMRLANANSKVFGVAIKDRAAILMTGHNANAAYWLDSNFWVTTEYYQADLPGYLLKLNEKPAIEEFRGKTWNLLLDGDKYHNQGPDKNDWENPPKGFDSEFPHQLLAAGEGNAKEFGDQVLASPFGNDYTLQAARAIVAGEELGRDDDPDLLCVNLSSNDYVGHAFGPHSLEVEDMTYRTDRQLGEFTDFLDQQVGAGRWTLFLSADHGVAPIVQYAVRQRLPAVRDPLPRKRVKAELEQVLCQALNVTPTGPTLIQELDDTQLFLRRDHPSLAGDAIAHARQIARDWIASQPHVATAKSREDLLSGSGDELHTALRRAFHPHRSGDVLWVYAPYAIPGDKSRGTTHGSPWFYDTHVPLLMLGAGVRTGQFDQPASPACIASTVARLVQVDPPAANVERPLLEALAN